MPHSLSGIGGRTNAAAAPTARNMPRSPRDRNLLELSAEDPELFQKELNRIASDQAGAREQTRLGEEAVDASASPARAVQAAAIPAALLSGPVGWGAGALLTAQGLADAYEDPNLLNVGMGLAGVIPGVRALRSVTGGARSAGRMSQLSNLTRATDDDIAGFVGRRVRSQSAGRPSVGWDEFDVPDSRVGAYTPNVSGYRPGPVGRVASEADEGLRASSYGASASDDVVTGAAQYSDFARRAPSAGGRTASAYRAGGAADDVATAQRSADDYAQQFVDDLPDVDGFDVVDDVVPEQGLPSMSAVDNLIAGMGNPRASRAVRQRGSPRLDAKVDADIADYRQRRQHGVAGFSELPELSGGELDRIMRNINRVTGGR